MFIQFETILESYCISSIFLVNLHFYSILKLSRDYFIGYSCYDNSFYSIAIYFTLSLRLLIKSFVDYNYSCETLIKLISYITSISALRSRSLLSSSILKNFWNSLYTFSHLLSFSESTFYILSIMFNFSSSVKSNIFCFSFFSKTSFFSSNSLNLFNICSH